MEITHFLRNLSDDDLVTLPYIIKAEQQRRVDQKQIDAIVNHQCKTYEEINRCPICCIP
jgi:hypothetical protein